MKAEQKRHYRPIGRGFIVNTPIPGEPPIGRSLAKVFVDHKNKKYIEINGTIEPLEEHHSFLAVD